VIRELRVASAQGRDEGLERLTVLDLGDQERNLPPQRLTRARPGVTRHDEPRRLPPRLLVEVSPHPSDQLGLTEQPLEG
jgi:hypothetical protein